ncbi:MAG: phosphatidylserine decarboxylase [Rhodospirillaceae bacterium]|nr:phosphatidylserine decarboxylase [Rhodospirillaceae bacterium]
MSIVDIRLYNRLTKSLEYEVVFERRFMEFFYGTRLGIWICEHLLKKLWFSRCYGRVKRHANSKESIVSFIEQYGIDTGEILRPLEEFANFNEFFIRELVDGARPIDNTPGHLISPADGRIIHYPITNRTVIPVKGAYFDIAVLLGDAALAAQYNGGDCFITRLAPTDYHRYGYIDSGRHDQHSRINGFLHSVSPYALQRNLRVFTENQRELCVLHTDNFGTVAQIDVGAMVVGRVVQHKPEGGRFERGEQKGYFEFGGSTVILLFEPGIVVPDQDILHYSRDGIETIVKYGSKIGQLA